MSDIQLGPVAQPKYEPAVALFRSENVTGHLPRDLRWRASSAHSLHMRCASISLRQASMRSHLVRAQMTSHSSRYVHPSRSKSGMLAADSAASHHQKGALIPRARAVTAKTLRAGGTHCWTIFTKWRRVLETVTLAAVAVLAWNVGSCSHCH